MGREGTLGGLLRGFRRRAHLTQEELAERAGVSVRTVRNLEADAVATPRLSSLRSLADALGLTDVDREALVGTRHASEGRVVGTETWQPTGAQAPVPLTAFIGRNDEVAALVETIEEGAARLVTVTGVAGIGKTRLAVAVSEALRARNRRLGWVSLSGVDETRFVLDAMASAVGAPEVSFDAIQQRLSRQPAVLVADNLEHLEGVGQLLAHLLERAPDLIILGTSRAPVGVVGEREWPLGPLPIPAQVPSEAPDVIAVASVEAVSLLVDRIRATDPSFTLTTDNVHLVAEVCRRLDGMPLALELAARQWRLRGATGVLDTIHADPLGLSDVTGTRTDAHASVRSALDASYRLLSDEECSTLHDLSVFRGGWTLEAAHDVVGAEPATDHLDRFMGLGLVGAAETDTGRRFEMPQIVQAFASAAVEGMDTSLAAERHAHFFLQWAARFETVEGHGVDHRVLSAFDTERDNLRAALRWFARNDPEAGLELAINLTTYWGRRARDEEALGWFETLLGRTGEAESRPLALMLAANHANFIGRVDEGISLSHESLDLSRRRGDTVGCAQAFGALGMLHITKEPSCAVDYCRRSVDLAASVGYHHGRLWAMTNLGEALLQLGKLDEARTAIETTLGLAHEQSVPQRAAFQKVNLAELLRLSGDLEAARGELDAADQHRAAVDDFDLDVHWLAQAAIVYAHLGHVERGRELAERAAAGASDVGGTYGNEAALAVAEVRLAEGEGVEACRWFGRSVVNRRPHDYPMRRVESLAGLAVAADDMEIAALASAAARSLRDEVGMVLPPVVEARLVAVDDRWSSSEPVDWRRHLTDVRSQRRVVLLEALTKRLLAGGDL